jgi:hypothetical protein
VRLLLPGTCHSECAADVVVSTRSPRRRIAERFRSCGRNPRPAMRNYKNKADASFGLLLLLGAVLALLLLVTAFDVSAIWGNPEFARLMVPFALMLGAFMVTRAKLLRAGVPWWAYLSMLGMTCLAAAAFVALPLHDIFDVYFGSHGRFGCEVLTKTASGEYRHFYFFRDQTAPIILFGPLFLGTALHWMHTYWAGHGLAQGPQFAGRTHAAEPAAAPNGGPAERLGNSGASGGPPSAS